MNFAALSGVKSLNEVFPVSKVSAHQTAHQSAHQIAHQTAHQIPHQELVGFT